MKNTMEDRLSANLPEWQQFKTLLFELSTIVLRSSIRTISERINESLERIAEFWNFDHVALVETQTSVNPAEALKVSIVHHCYCRSEKDRLSFNNIDDQIPWMLKKGSKGKSVQLSALPDALPPAAVQDKAFFKRTKIKSVALLPFQVGDSLQGALFVASLQNSFSWTDPWLKDLHYLAELLAGALIRKKTIEQMDQVLEFEHLLSETSAKYINLPTEDVDKMMQKDLGRLARLMGADRCIIYMINDDGKSFKPYLNSGWWPEEDNDLVLSLNPTWSGDQAFLNKFKYIFDFWRRGECLQWNQLEKLSVQGERMKRAYKRFGLKSQLSIPLSVAGATMGALTIGDTRVHKSWPENLIPRLRLFGEVIENALIRKQSEEALRQALMEVSSLKKRIEADYIYLREEIKLEHNFDEIIGQSNALKQVLAKAEQVAPTEATVLISGETGTGKELIARAVHNASTRKDRPLIKVNCAALAPSLIESELFGHEKGAFTGAFSKRVGRFEIADGATLFLDEVGELPLELQSKLLRVLQEGEFERVGGSRTLRTDVRIIAATNRPLQQEVEEGRFRRDLWYRLNAFPLHVPPLRDRQDDIPIFVRWFVDKYSSKIGKRFDRIPRTAINKLKRYHWPGNVRELENIIERAVITSSPGDLQIELPANTEKYHEDNKTLEQFERKFIKKALIETDWIIEGPNGAARRLGLKPSTLRYRMKILQISRPTGRRLNQKGV